MSARCPTCQQVLPRPAPEQWSISTRALMLVYGVCSYVIAWRIADEYGGDGLRVGEHGRATVARLRRCVSDYASTRADDARCEAETVAVDIAARELLRCRVIDATRTQEAIAAEVLAIVEPLLPIVAQSHPERVS